VTKVAPPPAAPAPAAPAPPSKEFGSFAITARVPGVEVFLGDRRLGEVGPGSRLSSGDLDVGVHRLRARKTGYKDWERS
jgi:hypothetical protein